MNRILNVHLLPESAHPHDLAGHATVVIDVLRASTTITTALDSGAEGIVPCLTVEEARELASKRSGALLGGERAGKPLPGFDLGNSPGDYTSDRVSGKRIVFTTTNGTKALMRCTGSAHVFIGCLVNRAAVCETLRGELQVDLVCAGTDGEFSMDDALAAGAIVDSLQSRDTRLNDAAETCHALWRCVLSEGNRPLNDEICAVLMKSLGGRNLRRLSMESDVDLASQLDRFEVVPELDRSCWEIRG